MAHTTFGYDSEQDRVWLNYAAEQPRIWITRRIAQGIAGPVTQLVERTAPGMQMKSVTAQQAQSQRVNTEHQLATTETPQGKPHYPFQVNVESREEMQEQGFVLCKVLRTHIESHGALIEMLSDENHVKFELSRQDLHLWLRAFKMALDDTGWNLDPPFPAWLTQPILPSAMSAIVNAPIPEELLQEMNEPDPNKPPPKN